eukprot:2097257-Rhodomonas_salina.3
MQCSDRVRCCSAMQCAVLRQGVVYYQREAEAVAESEEVLSPLSCYGYVSYQSAMCGTERGYAGMRDSYRSLGCRYYRFQYAMCATGTKSGYRGTELGCGGTGMGRAVLKVGYVGTR